MPSELSVASIFIDFWNHHTNPAAWITICSVIIITINLLGTGARGEAKFWFPSIEVITITGLIILETCLVNLRFAVVIKFSLNGPDDRLGFRFWNQALITQVPGGQDSV